MQAFWYGLAFNGQLESISEMKGLFLAEMKTAQTGLFIGINTAIPILTLLGMWPTVQICH